ncbi:MAG: DNA-directed RNA polymerase subunit H [Candidatus Aenigmarchaeota archaeon]|nr:DNA-directed RNA polymerase subunit H [Candidatus Aenigmarchaeota archaeon]
MKPKVNILDHELVPQHIILSDVEKQEVIEKYKIKKLSQFPTISHTDPAIQLIDAKPGDLIKITRKSVTAKETPYYRLVVER